MWPKLLRANATEAIGEKSAPSEKPPSTEAILAFLDTAERGKSIQTPLGAGMRLETREADRRSYFESKRTASGWVHRTYLAK